MGHATTTFSHSGRMVTAVHDTKVGDHFATFASIAAVLIAAKQSPASQREVATQWAGKASIVVTHKAVRWTAAGERQRLGPPLAEQDRLRCKAARAPGERARTGQ